MVKKIDNTLLGKTELEIQEYIKDKKVFMKTNGNGTLKWDLLYEFSKHGPLSNYFDDDNIIGIEVI